MGYQNQDETREKLLSEGEWDADTVIQPEKGGQGDRGSESRIMPPFRRQVTHSLAGPWVLADYLALFAFIAALASSMLSLSFGSRTPHPPAAGVLRRPNAYIGLDKVHYPKNFTFPSKKHWPIASFQFDPEDPKRALTQTVRRQHTVEGTVGLDDHYVVISDTVSTLHFAR